MVTDLVSGTGRREEIRLALGTTLTGVVRDLAGRRVPGAVVHVVPTDQHMETFTHWQEIATGPDGRFALPNVPAGREVSAARARLPTRSLPAVAKSALYAAGGRLRGPSSSFSLCSSCATRSSSSSRSSRRTRSSSSTRGSPPTASPHEACC